VFWFFTKNLATGNIKLEEGSVEFIGQRMVFLPVRSLIEIHKFLIKKFGKKEGCDLIYEIFKTGAIRFKFCFEPTFKGQKQECKHI